MDKEDVGRTFLVVQWLELHTSTAAGGPGLIPGQGTKIQQACDTANK